MLIVHRDFHAEIGRALYSLPQQCIGSALSVRTAFLDRLQHRSVVLNLDGGAYRVRDHNARSKLRKATTGTRQRLR